MEGAGPENASRNRNRHRGGRRRKYPALKDQKICLGEIIPPGADRVPGPSRAQIVPSPSHAQTPSPSRPQTVPRPSRAQTTGRSHTQTVPRPSRAKRTSRIHTQTVPGPSRAQITSPSRAQTTGPSDPHTVPRPTRAQKIGRSHTQTVARPSRAQTPGRSHPQTVHGPSSANSAPNPSHAQTSSVQSTGSVIGQEVEGVIDGTFQDGYLISIKIGEMTLKGVAYGMGTNEPDPAVEGQTVKQQNNNGVQESQGHDQMVAPMNGKGGQVVREVEATSLKLPKQISSQLAAETVRKVQPRSRIGNSGGGTSRNPTKHQDKGQARDVRGRGKKVSGSS